MSLCEVCGIYRCEAMCFPSAIPIVLGRMLPCSASINPTLSSHCLTSLWHRNKMAKEAGNACSVFAHVADANMYAPPSNIIKPNQCDYR